MRADCSTVDFYCTTIIRQQIFKGSFQVTEEGGRRLPQVTVERSRSQPSDIFGEGGNDCNLMLHLKTKRVFENLGGNCRFPP